jgi:hypothetical protein
MKPETLDDAFLITSFWQRRKAVFNVFVFLRLFDDAADANNEFTRASRTFPIKCFRNIYGFLMPADGD